MFIWKFRSFKVNFKVISALHLYISLCYKLVLFSSLKQTDNNHIIHVARIARCKFNCDPAHMSVYKKMKIDFHDFFLCWPYTILKTYCKLMPNT